MMIKKTVPCESTKKLVHGTLPRRKIIRAKRPPMSKTGFDIPTAPVSASDSPPAEGESEDAKSELELLLEGWGFKGNVTMDDAFIKSLDPAQVKQLIRVGLDRPRIRQSVSISDDEVFMSLSAVRYCIFCNYFCVFVYTHYIHQPQ